MKAVVTGAAGFIGSAVVRKLLSRGREVRCYVEPGASQENLAGLDVEIVEGDVCDRAAIARALDGADTLFHLAAIYALWLPDASRIYEVNVEGTKTVLWAAWKASLDKVVYTSSIAAIGRGEGERPADETCRFSARDWREGNAYIRSKWLSERDALGFAREGLPLVVVNPAFPFGERDRGPTPTGAFIVAALERSLPAYPASGFCAVDVDAVAEGHVLAAEKGRVGERYILGEHNLRYQTFFHEVASVAGIAPAGRPLPSWLLKLAGRAAETWSNRVSHKPPVATYKATLYSSRNLYFDSGKAERELGMPRVPLRDTLTRAVRWFRENGYSK